MTQVLKEEIRLRIYDAALDVFFLKDFKSATMKEIADKAGIPAGLIYSYYKNKQALFNAIVDPVVSRLPKTLGMAEKSTDNPFDIFMHIEREYMLGLFEKRREFIILIDKSTGTSHEGAKEKFIHMIEEHIKSGLKKRSKKKYDDLFPHILACNFAESLLEIARHYRNREWASEMLDLVAIHFFKGSNALYD